MSETTDRAALIRRLREDADADYICAEIGKCNFAQHIAEAAALLEADAAEIVRLNLFFRASAGDENLLVRIAEFEALVREAAANIRALPFDWDSSGWKERAESLLNQNHERST